ncbi:MAG: prenyltransferase/squalene oxidase repeat-containing protein [Phycisphaerales bacterium JB037]
MTFRTLGAACVLSLMWSAGIAVAAQPEAIPGVAPSDHTDTVAARAESMAARAIAFLRSQQDEVTGGWNHQPDGPNLPAITGLVVSGMLDDAAIDAADPAVARGLDYILSFRQPDGGIYDRILPSYNTAICLSALAKSDLSEAEALKPPMIRFLRGLQYSEEAIQQGEAGLTTQRVPREHPFYGGIGYGGSGRPDNSNLHFMMRALEDAGVPSDDPAVQRALVFLERTQMLDEVNDMPYADGSTQGGFIYATSPNSREIGVGESKAGTIEETLSDGTVASRLRAYGSITYAGFKSYAYAELEPDDPRVVAALNWIRSNYTLEENPGIGTDGLYYYYLTFARAMEALGEPTIDTIPEAIVSDETVGMTLNYTRDWRVDLIEALEELQEEDGGFRSVDDRWMENDRVLITAYSLIALQHARASLEQSPAAEPRSGS